MVLGGCILVVMVTAGVVLLSTVGLEEDVSEVTGSVGDMDVVTVVNDDDDVNEGDGVDVEGPEK